MIGKMFRGRVLWILAAAVAGVVASRAPQRPAGSSAGSTGAAGAAARFRILMGLGDAEPARWDGSIRVTGGRVTALEIWRPAAEDQIEGQNWKLSSRRLAPPGAAAIRAGRPGPLVENGILVAAELLDPGAKFDVQTAQGNFAFTAEEIPLGDPRSFLNGRLRVERVPVTTQITSSIEEQDYPAVALSGDTLSVAYVEFTHGDRSQKWPQQMTEKPKSFEALVRPAGGDQVLLIEYSRSKKAWSVPYPVSAVRQDVCRAAVAVDGEGRLWVIWSANARGNFDLYARYRQDGEWSSEMRLTQDPGPDLNPAAVTDSTGAVWIVWQGHRRDNLEVLLARQRGAGFAREETVSTSPASDWDPQIAAGPDGEVAVVWDTYDKGDYDVYLRRLRFSGKIGMEPAEPVAASRKFEARASVAYGAQNRVWVAYEESFPAWGKDFGAHETSGSGLYQGNTVRVKILEGKERLATIDKLEQTLALAATPPRGGLGGASVPPEQPEPELAKNRPLNFTPYPPPGPLRGYPRLAADPQGVVYLVYRTAAPATRSPLGSVWFENLVYFDGQEWTAPIFLPQSDNALDNRPALAAAGSGDLLVVSSSDHRHSLAAGGGRPAARGQEGLNNDLVLAEVQTGARARKSELTAAAAESLEGPDEETRAEREQVARMRNHRVALGSEKLQLLRGEFHRHTEISGDGGRDGALIDAWRYMIDAAAMDWAGCCDHDNGNGREYAWWTTQKLTDAYHLPGRFVSMFSHERSVRYPEGHRNLVFAQRGIRPLPRLPKTADESPSSPAPDTQMLYQYLRRFDGIAAVHTSGTDMGTDWRDNDPKVEPVVEIYQGDRQNYEIPEAPRSNTERDSIGGWRPLGFVSLALAKGYRLGFQASSDHISTHMSYCNLWVTEPTRRGVLEAFKKRRVYGATDNILAEVTAHGHFMGEEFRVAGPPTIRVRMWGTADFHRVHIIKDGQYAYTGAPTGRVLDFGWRDNDARPGTSYYYVRAEQVDGELVWVSPMWITIE